MDLHNENLWQDKIRQDKNYQRLVASLPELNSERNINLNCESISMILSFNSLSLSQSKSKKVCDDVL